MNRSRSVPASVLATVLVVSALMLLSVLGVLALWETDFSFFSRAGYLRRQRAHVESAFVLWTADSTLAGRLDADRTVQLYDSAADSRVRIESRPWGLYEAVRIEASDRRIASTRLLGAAQPGPERYNLWYGSGAASLTLAGRSALHGRLLLPRHGVQYGQMQSVFFSGERIKDPQPGYAGENLPGVRPEARRQTDSLTRLPDTPADRETVTDSLRIGFDEPSPRLLEAAGIRPGANIRGMAVLLGRDISLDSTCRLQNVLVVGHTIRIGDGFRGTVQLFASDTVLVGRGVRLDYPSGIFVGRGNPSRYAEIGAASRVEGYVIVDGDGRPDSRKPNYRQARSAVLRGLLWVDGAAQLQGIVSGCVAANRLVYYSTEGYYEDIVYQATILENPEAAYPIWAVAPYGRKEAAWLR